MAKADIWMPLYIGDYLADTTRLTTEQHGAYFLLIMDYWRNGAPPDDDEILGNIVKMSSKNWQKIKEKVMCFFTLKNCVWTHSRIDREIEDAIASKAKAEEKARKAAEARWGKHTNKDASSNAPSMSQAMHEECPLPSPSPLPIKTSTKSKPSAPAAPLPDWVPIYAWNAFVSMRKTIKKPVGKEAAPLLLNKLQTLRDGGNNPQTVLEQSTMNCWQGLFEIKSNQPRAGPAKQEKFDPLAYVNRNRTQVKVQDERTIDLDQYGEPILKMVRSAS